MMHVTIGICTYRREDKLRETLVSLQRSNFGDYVVKIAVIDNDPVGTAAWVENEFGELPVEYVHEPKAGIAAARNASLEKANENASDAIVFLDDDETVRDDWLVPLAETASRFGADVVQGVVNSYSDAPGANGLVPLHQRRIHQTGKFLDFAASNNTLLMLDSWRQLGAPRFDETFSQTGGSDTAFFYGLKKRGATMVACSSSVVDEEVISDRLPLSWLRTRSIRSGNVLTRVLLSNGDRLRFVKTLLKNLAVGAVFTGLSVVNKSNEVRRVALKFYVGVGMIRALVGRNVQEYARRAHA